ncbi:unnamed protein product [Linum tenue]|uniref:Uncharacterized protein n=1 Tax=Linum tenue TaxID=586396 RepID=A0AAV0IWH6_9ROSI|nr:unnamed protein product [Linum tenue]CAI0401992.1 unnamed protein product [Linum tenue]CAI0401993.1 unnamed protein product [Linum tenue]CAI0541851.1 unnamed protein product [Linum tenue]
MAIDGGEGNKVARQRPGSDGGTRKGRRKERGSTTAALSFSGGDKDKMSELCFGERSVEEGRSRRGRKELAVKCPLAGSLGKEKGRSSK